MSDAPGSVFIAEDDASMRKLLVHAARRAGFSTLAFATADGLLARLRHALDAGEPPSLILTDHRMPGRLGLEMIDVLRAWGVDIPFVLITAFPDHDLLDRAHRSGVLAVLGKPISVDDVVRTITLFAARAPQTTARQCWVCGAPGTSPCEQCEPTREIETVSPSPSAGTARATRRR